MNDTKDGPILTAEPLDDARDAVIQEHQLQFRETFLAYRKAVFWSLAVSTTIVMEGYDTMLVGNLFAQPAFQKQYGHLSQKGSWQIPASWQSGLANGSTVGQLVGLLLSGVVSERFGMRKTMLAGLVCITGCIFIQFFATTLATLEVGQVLFGIPLGLFQTTAVVYAHEVAPISLQGYLTTYINMCWAIGHLIGAGVLRGSLHLKGQWSYRMPFAVQWFWPTLLIPLVFSAPESPWWLVRQGRLKDSKAMQMRLASRKHESDIDKQTALMVFTTIHERELNSHASYRACFAGIDMRRTIVVIGIYCIQTLSGNTIRSSSTYFLEQAGLPVTQAFNMTVVSYALAVVGGVVAWAMMSYCGRRTSYVWSLGMMLILMLIIGGLGVPQSAGSSNKAFPWAIGSLLIVSSFLYNASIGPLTNTLCAEIPSSILRNKSIALARWFYAVSSIVAGVLQPYMTNPDSWNWGAKSGFFWAGGCLISLVFAYLLVPETKGRTTVEMDIMYERRVPAYKSPNTQLTEAVFGAVSGKD